MRILTKALGLFVYLLIISLLFDFDWLLLISPRPLLSVLLGTILLTVAQYKRHFTKEDLLAGAKWNLMLSSFLTTLISALAVLSPANPKEFNRALLADVLVPLLYGSILYLVLTLFFEEKYTQKLHPDMAAPEPTPQNLNSTVIANQVFRELQLTNRECHVAAKLLEEVSNKEIAAQLYISEATVKKHIQNIYQKLEVNDRTTFREFYLSKAKEKWNEHERGAE